MYDELVKRLRELPHLLFVQFHGHEDVVYQAADAIEELTGFVQEAERDRDEYRERLDKANDTVEELSKRVPTTPHGRLIDADALEYEEAYLNGHYELGDVEIVTRKDIESAPVIIPADEEE